MQFDWIRFLTDYNIPYWTEGKNCQIGYVNIKCPFHPDHSNHLGLNNYGFYGSCWVCGGHTGYDILAELVPHESYRELKQRYSVIHNLPESKKTYNNTSLTLPGGSLTEVHKKYIRGRGFDPDYLEQKYGLRGTTHIGKFNYRIIIPIYFNGRIVSYEGRDYTGKQETKTLPCPKELEIMKHNDILFNYDNCKSNKIIVCEGAWDVFRLENNSASCFTSNVTVNQLKLLSEYEIVYFIFDNEPEAQMKAKKTCVKLNSIGVNAENIQLDIANDPAELTDEQAKELKRILEVD